MGAVVEDEGFGGEGCCWGFGGFLAGHVSTFSFCFCILCSSGWLHVRGRDIEDLD